MPSQEDNSGLSFDCVIFDLDGVITQTAIVHAAAWKQMFNDYLKLRVKRDNEPYREFTYEHDYLTYVDGKPRYKGVQSFLDSRNIKIPFGEPDDNPDTESVCGLGNKKNVAFMEVLKRDGVEVYPSTVELIKELKSNEIHMGVASSSKNCQYVLQAAGIEDYFETRVDGVVSAELGLKGKPEGDIFVRACENMGQTSAKSIVVEDAVSGVQAGKNGNFGLVVGIAREGNENDLKNNGADVVIKDFAGIDIKKINEWFLQKNS